MPDATAQPKSRADAKLDNGVVADLPFFSQNRTKKHRAAILLAEDELTDEAIADAVGVTRRTIAEWKTHPEFQQIVGDYTGAIIAESLKLPIAKKHERIRQLNELNESYWQTIRLRGETYAQAAVTPEEAARSIFGTETPPWAATGMFVAQPKIAASGKTVTEWAFDKALDSAIKDTHKQAAQELGQWAEKHEHAGPEGTPLTVILTEREDGPR